MKNYSISQRILLTVAAVLLSFSSTIAQQSDIALVTKNNSTLPIYFPLDKNDFIRVSSRYGYRLHPILKKNKKHQGIDLVAAKGKPVFAAASGTVEKADFVEGYGNRILLAHREDIKTLYGHLWIKMVTKGDTIQQGQIIGLVGDTGRVTGPHLHYEIWLKGKRVDPLMVWRSLIKKEDKEIAMNQ
ncbi:M23 family metallopeptidase [Aquimarina sp. D1M17]|uniref:M23 family metallopeptidase n=1 Tax=Aquimarina acroporae TaxID=2937283 RepID=UPI0020BED6B5|nr:M23 family metallopeptidase [Aquimarina acroporae]MCK8521189.1 M23 family metallopeptidase [Aquimarina acroporae]